MFTGRAVLHLFAKCTIVALGLFAQAQVLNMLPGRWLPGQYGGDDLFLMHLNGPGQAIYSRKFDQDGNYNCLHIWHPECYYFPAV